MCQKARESMTTKELLIRKIERFPESKLRELLDIAKSMENKKIDREAWLNELDQIIGDDRIDIEKIKPPKRSEIYEELL